MKILFKLSIWLFSLLIATACYSETISLTAPFPTTLTIDSATWSLDFKQQNEDNKIGEYVTNHETVDNWTQLITLQYFNMNFSDEVTPKFFADSEIEQFKTHGYELDYSVISASPEEAIIEFKVKKPIADQQDELQRILKTKNQGVFIIHYVIKKPDMGESERTKWIGFLKSITLQQ